MSLDDKHYRKATMRENLMLIRARLSDHLSPAEMRELQEAAVRLQECDELHAVSNVAATGETPRTDAAWEASLREPYGAYPGSDGMDGVTQQEASDSYMCGFARKLERELAQVGALVEKCHAELDKYQAPPSSTRPNHFAALEKRGLYMPPGILVRLIKVANCTPREQVYPDDARYLVGVLQELTFSKSLPSETPPSATRDSGYHARVRPWPIWDGKITFESDCVVDGMEIKAGTVITVQSGGPAKAICEQCGVDRFKAPCPMHNAALCPMTGKAT